MSDLDKHLRQAYARQPVPPVADLEDAVMARLTAPQRKPAAARILTVYWIVAAVAAVGVLASIGWFDARTSVTAALMAMAALALVAAPLLLWLRLAGIRLADVLWHTLTD